MAISDPIADTLTRIRNAVMARHDTLQMPASRMRMNIARILKEEGFITNYEAVGRQPKQQMKIFLKYDEKNQPAIAGLERVSKPGLRVYVGHGEIPRVLGGLGITMVSTPKGVMVGHKAWRQRIGGELLCKIW